ncbi:MAG: Sec-independent protein translocase protein TatA [Steroidobacteraceae bacterium]|nr:Sec-independent protein translocase protein TatA [Steroidobacteraceae bacterium]
MGIGMRELIVILLVVLLVFGAKKLRTIGSDLGAAVRGFKKSMNEGEAEGNADDVKQLKAGEKDAEFPEVARRDADSKIDRGA